MSARRIALEALLDITDRGAYANLRLKEARQAEPKSARWVTAAVYGTLDHLIPIDYLLQAYCKGRVKPAIRGILRLGAAELLYMRTPARAAVHESANLAREVGKSALVGYVNGVLRGLARDMEAGTLPAFPDAPPVRRLSVRYSWPEWIVARWLAQYGEAETERLLAAELPDRLTIRPQAPYTDAELEAALEARGIAYARGRWDPLSFHLQAGLDLMEEPLFSEGKIAIQSESAMLACRAAGIEPGMRALDACAAPGGKTAYLSALASGQAKLTAWELHPHRKALLDATLARLGVLVETEVQDAGVSRPECAEAFDLVFIDAPCSGLGVRKPDARYQKTSEGLAAIVEAQARILDTVAGFVRPGGALLYATCTLGREENADQIAAFLAHHPEYTPDSLSPYLPAGLPGLASGMLELLPERDGLEGFFIARLRRKDR